MAKDSVLVNGVVNTVSNTLETIYSAAEDTLIKAVTVSNVSGVNASYSMNIVPDSGDTSNPEIPFRVVVRLKSDTGAEVVNHVIPKGGTLRAESSAAGSIAYRVTGRVLTP